ncbi:MAG: cyclic pyranopterin monophosphate synthase MoaC [Gammaproteobacteria bacterium]|nr:cyclic pyranopterin monophosphate synthase MoaC [Gammaproteobacteria bacterium]MDH4313848.1 cyclic pyranopterin monophosphate synthase MoaC [Gammaproteobacteria bacterium]MDH5213674.1 cyclic pyranopterin monophosphate synthase MoaC [Gammaproteobacteria bacterium]MDH5500892.1 cyclic pyranopterin monophosphate synthase MoaC [Gammaproteobacteria bacterium]
MSKLSHIDSDNRPAMVDVSQKTASAREAHARSIVEFPAAIAARFVDGDIRTAKGPVFATAIVAGVMAAKKAHELIPFCHPLGLDNCDISISMDASNRVLIDCRCKVTHKTGVEMEALTGASVAALTVYDMCKALSHDITIRETRLMSKTGGKQDFIHEGG